MWFVKVWIGVLTSWAFLMRWIIWWSVEFVFIFLVCMIKVFFLLIVLFIICVLIFCVIGIVFLFIMDSFMNVSFRTTTSSAGIRVFGKIFSRLFMCMSLVVMIFLLNLVLFFVGLSKVVLWGVSSSSLVIVAFVFFFVDVSRYLLINMNVINMVFVLK